MTSATVAKFVSSFPGFSSWTNCAWSIRHKHDLERGKARLRQPHSVKTEYDVTQSVYITWLLHHVIANSRDNDVTFKPGLRQALCQTCGYLVFDLLQFLTLCNISEHVPVKTTDVIKDKDNFPEKVYQSYYPWINDVTSLISWLLLLWRNSFLGRYYVIISLMSDIGRLSGDSCHINSIGSSELRNKSWSICTTFQKRKMYRELSQYPAPGSPRDPDQMRNRVRDKVNHELLS